MGSHFSHEAAHIWHFLEMWNALVRTWQVRNWRLFCWSWLAIKDHNSKVSSIIYPSCLRWKFLDHLNSHWGWRQNNNTRRLQASYLQSFLEFKYYLAGLKWSFPNPDPGNPSYINTSFSQELRSLFRFSFQWGMCPGSKGVNKELKCRRKEKEQFSLWEMASQKGSPFAWQR